METKGEAAPFVVSPISRKRILIALVLVLTAGLVISYILFNDRGSIRPGIPCYLNKIPELKTEVSLPLSNSSSVYAVGDMVPREINFTNSKLSNPPPYADPEFAGKCGYNEYHRKQLFYLLKWWINFAAEHNIIWWLRDGTLIGSKRHRDMVPWDTDMDLAVIGQFEPLIRNLSTPRSLLNRNAVNMVTRPGPHCPYNGPRTDCKGNMVSSHVDGCAFCGPLARIFYDPNRRVDLYLSSVEFVQGQLMLFDESHFEYTTARTFYPFEWYFPLRNCTFMGLTVLCPRFTEKVLNAYYGSYKSKYYCNTYGKWIKIS